MSLQALADFDGVATVGELSGAILAALPPAPAPDDHEVARIATGLLRVALDRTQALGRADDETAPLSSRRRGGKIILLATDPALLDPAEAIGRMADHLVASADAAGEPLIPAQRAIPRLQPTWARAADSRDTDQPIPSPERLLRLAAALAEQAALSGRRELHRLDLPAATALGIALTGAASIQRLTPQEIRDRFRARFPALPPLPERPRLDELIRDAGLDLLYDELGPRLPPAQPGRRHHPAQLPAGHDPGRGRARTDQRRPGRPPPGRERRLPLVPRPGHRMEQAGQGHRRADQ